MDQGLTTTIVSIAGGVLASHATQLVKGRSLNGRLVHVLAAVIAVVLGLVGAYLQGYTSWYDIAAQSSWVFSVSMVYYRLILKGDQPALKSEFQSHDQKAV